jgi:hypothetical protein
MTYIRFMCGTYMKLHIFFLKNSTAAVNLSSFFKFTRVHLQSTIIQAWCLVFGGMFMLK